MTTALREEVLTEFEALLGEKYAGQPRDRIGRFASGLGGGVQLASDTPNLDQALAANVQVSGGNQEYLQQAWEQNPKEARILKEKAQQKLDEMYPGKDKVTVWHVGRREFYEEGLYSEGLKPFTSFTTSKASANQFIEDFGLTNERPVIFKMAVPKGFVATFWAANPIFNQPGLPASYQKEILFDHQLDWKKYIVGFSSDRAKSLESFLDDQEFWEETGDLVKAQMAPVFRKLLEAGAEVGLEEVLGTAEKDNPCHDERGRFCETGGGGAQLSVNEQEAALEKLSSLERVEAFRDGPKDSILNREAGWEPQKHLEIYAEWHEHELSPQQKKSMVLADIPRKQIHYVQSTVPVAGVEAYIRKMPSERPVVGLNPKGELWTLSGHTRLTAQWLAGRETAQVLVMGVTDRGKQVRQKPDLSGVPGAEVVQASVKQLSGTVDTALLSSLTEAESVAFATQWWQQIETTTKDRLRSAIRARAETGMVLEDLIKDIEPLFGEKRAEAIAVTETTRLFARGAVLSYQAADVREVEWRTVEDSAVEEICRGLNGQKWPIGQHQEPPAHIRCRCFLSPVVEIPKAE